MDSDLLWPIPSETGPTCVKALYKRLGNLAGSWILFLKYLDALEQKKAIEAELEGKAYSFILDASYQWANWAAPKTADGKFDHNNALTGDDLKDFVNLKLFPYLKGFKFAQEVPERLMEQV